MKTIIRSFPKWFPAFVLLYILAWLGYGVATGRHVSFWPPSVGAKPTAEVPSKPEVKAASPKEALYLAGMGIYNAYYWVSRGEQKAAGFKDGFARAGDMIRTVVIPNAKTGGIEQADAKAKTALSYIDSRNKDLALKALNDLNQDFLATINSK